MHKILGGAFSFLLGKFRNNYLCNSLPLRIDNGDWDHMESSLCVFSDILNNYHSNKGFSRPRHLQAKGCKTGMCRQAWSFPLFDPM